MSSRRLLGLIPFLLFLGNLAPAFTQTGATQRGVFDTTAKPSTPEEPGPYYALVIGNDHYRYLGKLSTPVNDAKAVAQTLHDQFGFEVKVLPNATRHAILSALDEYSRTLSENANLLIYYGGHGHHDRNTEKGYWLPVEAELGSRADWISADDSTNEIRAIPARHVLIVSDSCYSGMLTRDVNPTVAMPRDRSREIEKALARKSRWVMSSGGDEPVTDVGPSGHSIFANAFLQGLRQMEEDQFTGEELSARVKRQVGGGSDQLPEYNPIRNSGDEGGDFVFFRLPVPTAAPKTALAEPTAPAAVKPEPAAGPSTGTVRVSSKDGLRYVWIPPGTFEMGCSRDNENALTTRSPRIE